ncbi:hypothetical protein AAIB48_20215 (plasmid) [Paraclostridium benzoelyticum]
MDKMNKVDKIIGGSEIPNCVDERIDETKAFIKREKEEKRLLKIQLYHLA